MRKIHGLSDEDIDGYVQHVQAAALVVDVPAITSGIVTRDPDDDPIIATAVTGQAEKLCTRDRHLRHPNVRAYCSTHGFEVVTDIELLHILRAATPPPPTP